MVVVVVAVVVAVVVVVVAVTGGSFYNNRWDHFQALEPLKNMKKVSTTVQLAS